MENIHLVHKLICDFDGKDYLIEIYVRHDGSHYARTEFTPHDVIISDGISLEDALLKHKRLLPLAISSRKMPQSSRLIN